MNESCNSCEQIIELLDAYHDQELSESENKAVEQHIKNCPSCNERLSEVKIIVQSLQDLPRLNKPYDLIANWSNFSQSIGLEEPKVRRPRYSALAWAASILLLAATFFGLRSHMMHSEIMDRQLSQANDGGERELLALYPSELGPSGDEIGIATDDDGLYALKL